MKVQIVNFKPFLSNADAPCLTPPEMGAAFARFSRNNEGLDAILESVKDIDETKRVDKIMSFADYGHRSILDLVEVPIIIEGISMYAAARLFQFSKLSAGQESSTRYIKKGFNILPFVETTITRRQYVGCENLFQEWISNVNAIPEDAPRATRNKTLDKVRYSLPVIATTNVAIKMSIRAWQETLRYLRSYPDEFQKPELIKLVDAIKYHLKKSCGDFAVKHTDFNYAVHNKLLEQFELLPKKDSYEEQLYGNFNVLKALNPKTNISRKNRYDPWPYVFDNCVVSLKMHIAFAELRDLNRHRNRIANVWNLDIDDVAIPTLGTIAYSHAQMTLSQLLYEIEIRTSQGAHPSYRRKMNLVLDLLFKKIRMESMDVSDYILKNIYDNTGMESEG